MDKENFEKLLTINSVDILISLKFKEKKRKAIDRWLHTQLKGLLNIDVEGMKCKRIYLEPYSIDSALESEVVPGAYRFTPENKKLHLTNKKISLSILNEEIHYGFNTILGLSIHFLYFLCSVQSNKTLVHAAGFKHKEKNILVPAFGGIGKTFLVSKLSQNLTTSIYGDDLVLLDNNNVIFPYHRPMCMYQYHYENYLKDRLPRRHYFLKPSLLWRILFRLRIEILDRFGFQIGDMDDFSAHSKGYITTAVGDILNDRQIPKHGESLDIIVVIKRTSASEIVIKEVADIEERKGLATYISAITHHEWAAYHKLMLAYSAFTKQRISEQFKISENLIENAFLTTKKVCLIQLPVNAKDLDIEQALDSLV